MAQTYHIRAISPEMPPPDVPGAPVETPYRPPTPGDPPSTPGGPVEEPPLAPPIVDDPSQTPIPSPIVL